MAQTKINEFLRESNAIEREYSEEAFADAQKAWEYAFVNRDNLVTDYVLEIHRLLMQRLNPTIAGKFRDCDVWIGGQHKIFISETLLKDELWDIINNININLPIGNKNNHCKQTHIDFEHLHPFVDGNGRVGRILYNIHRIKLGLSIHIIHVGEEQMEYYKWFRG